MPTLAQYAPLEPFELNELVEAANAVLRDRPRLLVSPRTVRYYISKEILGPAKGTKSGRYGLEHLLRLVGARCLLDEGKNLERARERLDTLMAGPEPLPAIQEMVSSARMSPSKPASPFVRESLKPAYSRRFEGPALTVRIDLGEGATLELAGSGDLETRIEQARDALMRLDPSLLASQLGRKT